MGTTVFGICVTNYERNPRNRIPNLGKQGGCRLGRHENPSLIRYDLKNEWKLAS